MKLEVAQDFTTICRSKKSLYRFSDWHRNLGEEKTSNSVVITVPADDLAPLGARPSAGTVMYKDLHLKSLVSPWNISRVHKRLHEIIDLNRIWEENTSNSVINVPADGLAPLGARPSAGTVMPKFTSHVYT